jgi:hypothetical protein
MVIAYETIIGNCLLFNLKGHGDWDGLISNLGMYKEFP